MTLTLVQNEVAAETHEADCDDALLAVEDRRQSEAEAAHEHMQDKGDFVRLSRRYAQLARSFVAVDQRERSSLKDPLMKLYVKLNPATFYKGSDDIDVILRAERRGR